MGISRTGSNVWKLPSVRKTFMLVNKRFLWTNVTDVLGSVRDCYVGKPLDDVHIELLNVPAEKCDVCDEVEYGIVVECSSECKGVLSRNVMFGVPWYKYR